MTPASLSDQALRSLSDSQIALFWSKVNTRKKHECWPWKGATNPRGYGTWTVNLGDGKTTSVRPHRVAYTLRVGPIKDGLEIDHLCEDRLCCNPAHLKVSTRAENNQRTERPKKTTGVSASIQTRQRRDGSTAYRVMFRLDSKLVGETFDDIGAAETFRDWVQRFGPRQARALRRRRSGLSSDSEPTPTVTEWVERHIEALSGVEPGTKSDYRSYNRISIAGTELGSLPVNIAEPEDVGAWIDDLAENYSSKSIKNRHALLSAAFAYAVTKKLRSDNPARGQRIPESEGREAMFLTHGEFALLLGHIPTYWQPLVATMAGTGLRWGEITALRIRDLHLDDTPPTLSVLRAWKHTDGKGWRLGAPKSRKGKRTIGLSPNVVRLLRVQIEGKAADDLVFPNHQGRPIRHNTFHEMVWTKAVAAATRELDGDGNPIPADRRLTKYPRPHDLRHSHASWLIAQGVPLTEIQYRLGHESIKTTSDLYGHLVPGHLERSAAAAEIALAQALPELVQNFDD